MLTYADGIHAAVRLPLQQCWRRPRRVDIVCWRPGTEFTSFTSTKVQTLTPEELQGYEGLHNEGSQVPNSILTFDQDSAGWTTVLNLLVL